MKIPTPRWLHLQADRRHNPDGDNMHRRRTDENLLQAKIRQDLDEAQRRIAAVKRQVRVMGRRNPTQ